MRRIYELPLNSMRPMEFGEALPTGTRLTLYSEDKPGRFFTVTKFWINQTLGASLALKTRVPCYQVEDQESRIHLLLHLPIEEESEAAGAFGGPIRRPLILVSGPITDMAFAGHDPEGCDENGPAADPQLRDRSPYPFRCCLEDGRT